MKKYIFCTLIFCGAYIQSAGMTKQSDKDLKLSKEDIESDTFFSLIENNKPQELQKFLQERPTFDIDQIRILEKPKSRYKKRVPNTHPDYHRIKARQTYYTGYEIAENYGNKVIQEILKKHGASTKPTTYEDVKDYVYFSGP